MWREIHGRGSACTHTRGAQGSRRDLAMLHLLYSVGTMAYTNTTHSWSAPLRFLLFGGLFLRPPWNMEATERLALDNQLWRGWKIQFISPLFLRKQPLEQEMTVDVLIFKRWAPLSLRLYGRICSHVTEPAPRLSSLPVQNPFFLCVCVCGEILCILKKKMHIHLQHLKTCGRRVGLFSPRISLTFTSLSAGETARLLGEAGLLG